MSNSDKVAQALQVLSERLTRQLETSMHACAHCGLCNDSCHYFVSIKEPEMVPTYKADRLRNVWKRRYDWLGQIWPWYVGARDLDDEVIQELWDTAWGACTMCGRCVTNCPFGVDTRLIIGTARAMLGAIDLVPFDGAGFVDPDAIRSKFRPNTRLVIVNHVSNVIGTVQPIRGPWPPGRVSVPHGIRNTQYTGQRWPQRRAEMGPGQGDRGAVRSGIGPFNTKEHIQAAITAVAETAAFAI